MLSYIWKTHFSRVYIGNCGYVLAEIIAFPSKCSHVKTNHCSRVRPSAYGRTRTFPLACSKNDLAFLGIITLSFMLGIGLICEMCTFASFFFLGYDHLLKNIFPKSKIV